jgi:WD40 repeat protein
MPAAASAGGIFGTYPLDISVAPNGAPADGASSAPAVSGDNRKTRYAAFQSDATNLVAGDTNGVTDIFLWSRPKGREGLTLPKGSGSLQRVSVASNGAEANGPSRNPSLDGSVTAPAHCVAFESDASNLAPGDADTTTDIFVRDLRSGQTILVSRGITGPATDPSISGDCSKVAFVADGQVLVAPVKAGAPKVIAAGANPHFSLDGRALAWEQGDQIAFMRDGKKAIVGPGSNPTVTDAERLHGKLVPSWGVSFDSPAALSSKDHNPGIDTYLRVYGPKGGPKRTDLITFAQPKVNFDGLGDNRSGGITAYGTNRGILTYIHTDATATDAYYWNQHTGNADDIAHAATLNGQPGITEMVTSARANFVAFTSAFTGSMASAFGSGRSRAPLPSVESLFSPFQSVYFKMLVDGEAI